jgi:plastocyanin
MGNIVSPPVLETGWGRRCVALLALAALDCGGSGGYGSPPTTTPTTTAPPASADVLITIAGIAGSMSYDPNPARVRVGQTVAWRNADTVPHTSSEVGNGGFDTGTIVAGATSLPLRMTLAGSLDYFCRIHPSMVARIDVAP